MSWSPGGTEVGAQNYRRDVQELGYHELHHRAGIQVRPVEVEQAQVARYHLLQVLVPDVDSPTGGLFQVLRYDAVVPAVRMALDGLSQNGVADEMLVVEEFTGEIDAEWVHAAVPFRSGHRANCACSESVSQPNANPMAGEIRTRLRQTEFQRLAAPVAPDDSPVAAPGLHGAGVQVPPTHVDVYPSPNPRRGARGQHERKSCPAGAWHDRGRPGELHAGFADGIPRQSDAAPEERAERSPSGEVCINAGKSGKGGYVGRDVLTSGGLHKVGAAVEGERGAVLNGGFNADARCRNVACAHLETGRPGEFARGAQVFAVRAGSAAIERRRSLARTIPVLEPRRCPQIQGGGAQNIEIPARKGRRGDRRGHGIRIQASDACADVRLETVATKARAVPNSRRGKPIIESFSILLESHMKA